jgi:hypothetical protein
MPQSTAKLPCGECWWQLVALAHHTICVCLKAAGAQNACAYAEAAWVLSVQLYDGEHSSALM